MTGTPDGVRTFGVEEELLLVDARTLRPLPVGERIVAVTGVQPSGQHLATELKREQVEVVSPPQVTLTSQLDAIRRGRAMADRAAAARGARAVALSTCPSPVTTTVTTGSRAQRIAEAYAITVVEQLTCGLHVHVGIDSPEEGVAVLDRVRVWLPVLLALSANSPFWMGLDTGYASYRYQAWGRWPTAGPTDLFGSPDAYERHTSALLASGVPLDEGMLYFDARLSSRYPTVEIRVLDVPLLPEHSAALAALTRALVEACARQWRAGGEAPRVSAQVLRAWTWQASRAGMDGDLVDPTTGRLAPCVDVVGALMGVVGAVLDDYGERDAVATAIDDIVTGGTGAARQRRFQQAAPDNLLRHDLREIVERALEATHRGTGGLPAPGPRDEPLAGGSA